MLHDIIVSSAGEFSTQFDLEEVIYVLDCMKLDSTN